MTEFVIEPKKYKIEEFSNFLQNNTKVVLSEESIELINDSRKILENAVQNGDTI